MTSPYAMHDSDRDMDEDETIKRRNRTPIKVYKFKKKNIPVLLSKMKKLLKEPKNKVQQFAKTERAHREATKKKCTLDSLKFASSESESLKPQLAPFILSQFRRCLLRHDWSAAKRLLLIFLKNNAHHRVSWTACLTSLVHFPGAESVLREFVELNKGNYNSEDLLQGLLTINGLEAYRPSREEEEEDSECDTTDTTDSEDVDDVEEMPCLSGHGLEDLSDETDY